MQEADVERAVRALHAAFDLEAASMSDVGVVGATGLVGQEMLRILEERAFPVERAAGLRLGPVRGPDAVRSPAARSPARSWATAASTGSTSSSSTSTTRSRSSGRRVRRQRGARVVDNSAAFRMDPDVPLVVAEVNPDDLRTLPKGIASCPNCTTMVLVTALAPLHRAAGIERMVVSTYQSVSGAGQPGMHELDEQWTKVAGQMRALAPRRDARRCARSGRGVGPSRSPAT